MHRSDVISDIPRWLQIALGLLLGVFAVFCSLASLSLLFPPAAKNPMLSIAVGAIAVLGGWAVWKAVRLILGRPLKGGLLSPFALRVSSIVVLCLPVCGLFTGYFQEHPILAPIQGFVYAGISFTLWRMARSRALRARHETSSQTTESSTDPHPASLFDD